MTDNVTSLNARRAMTEGDNRLWSPVECLRDCIEAIENGEIHCDRLLICRVNIGEGDTWNVGYNAANINGSTAVALLETVKVVIMNDMGYPKRLSDD